MLFCLSVLVGDESGNVWDDVVLILHLQLGVLTAPYVQNQAACSDTVVKVGSLVTLPTPQPRITLFAMDL
jgi:hypothetical protein